MNAIQKRFLGFLGLCIPSRIFFVYLAKKIDRKYLPYLGYLSLLPAIGFFTIYMLDLRKTGIETQGSKIWWNNLRPVHAFLYFYFAYLAINSNINSYKILLFDVIIGLVAFLIYHFQNNSFSKIDNIIKK